MNWRISVWADVGVNQKEMVTEKEFVSVYIYIHTHINPYVYNFPPEYTETWL